jgi:hypothetical protein
VRVVSPETAPTEGDKIYALAEGYWLVINAHGGAIIPPASSPAANRQVKLGSGDILVINEGYGHVTLTGGPLKTALHNPNLRKEALGGGFWMIAGNDGAFILQAGSK